MGGASQTKGALPIDHLSASSITLFKRCPKQWQQKYLLGERSVSNAAVIIGSAVHIALSRLLVGEINAGDYWAEAVREHQKSSGTLALDWSRCSEHQAREIAATHVRYYMQVAAPFLGTVKATEQEISVMAPGVDVPVIGFVDIETDAKVVDVKTTAYFNRKPSLNPEWAFQLSVYQLKFPKPAEIHVLARGDKYPVNVPASANDPLYRDVTDPSRTLLMIQQAWETMQHYWSKYGTHTAWPGNETQEWGHKYCSVPDCCAISKWQ